MRYYIQRHSHKIFRYIILIFLLLGFVLGVRYLISHRQEIAQLTEQTSNSSEQSGSQIISRVLFAGTVGWGDALAQKAALTKDAAPYPFSGLQTLTKSEYDIWIAQLDCDIATFASDCDATYLGQASKWFGGFMLGSMMVKNPDQTRTLLASKSLQFTGDYDDEKIENLCDVFVLPARIRETDGSYKVSTLPLAMCSFDISSTTPETKQFDEVTRLSKLIPTIVYVASGSTSVAEPTELQKAVYRSFIDSGADMVLGNNGSLTQSAEEYKGRLIAYSLGNFIYDGSSTETEIRRGIGLGAVISTDTSATMDKWLSLANICIKTDDDCVSTIRDMGVIDKPHYSYRLSIVTVDSINEPVTTKSRDTWEEMAAKRLNWDPITSSLTAYDQ